MAAMFGTTVVLNSRFRNGIESVGGAGAATVPAVAVAQNATPPGEPHPDTALRR